MHAVAEGEMRRVLAIESQQVRIAETRGGAVGGAKHEQDLLAWIVTPPSMASSLAILTTTWTGLS